MARASSCEYLVFPVIKPTMIHQVHTVSCIYCNLSTISNILEIKRCNTWLSQKLRTHFLQSFPCVVRKNLNRNTLSEPMWLPMLFHRVVKAYNLLTVTWSRGMVRMSKILILSYRLKEAINSYVLHCLETAKNCPYLCNQMSAWDGI